MKLAVDGRGQTYASLQASLDDMPFGADRAALVRVRLGIHDDPGRGVVGARRAALPTAPERVFLLAAVSQAVMGLDEARRSNEEGVRRRSPGGGGQKHEPRDVSAEGGGLLTARGRPERERLLASLVENSDDFIGLASASGQCWFINASGAKLVGIAPEQVETTTLFDCVTADDARRLEREVLPAVACHGRWDGELVLRHVSTGAPLPMQARVFSVYDPGADEPLGLAIVGRDVSRRRQAEAGLMALKDELAAELAAMTRLHEFSTQLLAKRDLSPLLNEVLGATMALQNAEFGHIRLYNPANGELEVAAQVGFADAPLELLSKADAQTACGRSIASRRRVIIEDVFADEDFAPHRATAEAAGFRAVQATPLFSSTGEPLGVLSTHFRRSHRPSERDLRFTDLYARQAAQAIERERTQAALRRSEFHLAEAQRISHTGSWVWNMTTGEVLWSDEYCRIFGFEPGRVSPTHELFWETLHPDDREFVRKRIAKAVDERRDFDEQFRLARRGGSVRHIHGVGHPVLNDGGELVEYIGAVVDITERKLAEEAARRAENDLARVSRALSMGELTASIAHEIRQPLAAVVVNADACVRWLVTNPPNLPEVDACARRVARDAHRASEVITRIRTLLTRGQPQKAELAADDVLLEVVSLIREKARAHGVTVQVLADPELPPFFADRIQVQQVLLNLALNGIEAMRAVDERSRQLEIGAALHGARELRFHVRDSGPGLDPAQRNRVFDAFYTTKDQGMGMGLAICRSIVDAHGGRLWVDQNGGPGETFQFTLPLAGAPFA